MQFLHAAKGFDGQKKRPLFRRNCPNKGLVDRISVLVPGCSTVLTESRSAFSPADNYSPLFFKDNYPWAFLSRLFAEKHMLPLWPVSNEAGYHVNWHLLNHIVWWWQFVCHYLPPTLLIQISTAGCYQPQGGWSCCPVWPRRKSIRSGRFFLLLAQSGSMLIENPLPVSPLSLDWISRE